MQTSKAKLKDELREIFVIQTTIKGIIFLIHKALFQIKKKNNLIQHKANNMDEQRSIMNSQCMNKNTIKFFQRINNAN